MRALTFALLALPLPALAEPAMDLTHLRYDCETGGALDVVFVNTEESAAIVSGLGTLLPMHQVVSASGAIYEGDGMRLLTDGQEASLALMDGMDSIMVLDNCTLPSN